MALGIFGQAAFTALNRQLDPTQLSSGQYALGVNVRGRNGGPEIINLPLLIKSLPNYNNSNSIVQGIYTINQYVLAFISGLAYIADYSIGTPVWNQVGGFLMSSVATTIYAAVVPASTVNYLRKLSTTNVSGAVDITATDYNQSPAVILCQDSVSQPVVILPSLIARPTQSFSQWTISNREYVPIGRQMLFTNGILYTIMQDPVSSKWNQIAQSVVGRPLDYMVNIDTNGAAGGDALTTAYSIDYDSVTALTTIGATQGAFIAATARNTYLITPNTTTTYFGNPTYSNQRIFPTGPLNQFSTVDILGDQALIDFESIKSFNAILNTKFMGRNAPFSASIQPLFGQKQNGSESVIIQQQTAACTFDNYAYFAVSTIYGALVLVYDTITQAWVSLDIYPGVSTILQFAILQYQGINLLFFRDSDNNIYEAFSGDLAEGELYVGEWSAQTQQNVYNYFSGKGLKKSTEMSPQLFYVAQVGVTTSGSLQVACYIDGQFKLQLERTVTATTSTDVIPIARPFGNALNDDVKVTSLDFATVPAGWKVGFYLKWNYKGKLLEAGCTADVVEKMVNIKEQSSLFAQYTKANGKTASVG